MSSIDQIVYRAPGGSSGRILQAASSIWDQAESESWLRRLDPWLRTGNPLGRGYLDFGSHAAFIRWYTQPSSRHDWQVALILAGQPTVLTGGYALELPELDAGVLTLPQSGRLLQVTRTGVGPDHAAIEARARSKEAIELLVPLLARVLAGERSVTMPWTEPSLPEAVLWGLVSILSMLGDTRPVSFLTYASRRAPNTQGLFVSFRPGAASLQPDPGFETVAIGLATRFADGPAELRRTLYQHGMLEPTDHAGRITRLLGLWSGAQTISGETQPVKVNTTGVYPPPSSSSVVICPICLDEIENWDTLQYWRWDATQETYVELPVPPGLTPIQRDRLLRGAYVRCPARQSDMKSEHHLPLNYGRFGPPVLLGFIGLTQSGKSHLLASMVGAIQRGELQEYGITSRPIDHALHQRFLEGWVNPLFNHARVLPGTQEGIVTFADAFLMRHENGPERPVALFDVAGGDLARVDDTKHFLWIANGLFFIIDPEHMDAHRLGDETFSNVLGVVEDQKRSGQVSAAIVLNKADKVRFEEPVARWLRTDSGVLDPAEFLRESSDVYAYLHQKGALALAGPYRLCDKATLHIASPTGGACDGEGEGSIYPRGVTPRRVLRPLVAMLAMTGVLTGPEAEEVGI
jgi:hypothetical protein